MKTISSLILVFIGLGSSANTNIKYSTKEYVEEWKEVAISQMQSFGIPASITLAQAILESANGNSDLAIIANNHFGIKCNTWKGDTYYKNDDQANECFRKYNSAKESYDDHSQFLKNKTRYASLFNLEKTDYKAWAQGLKDAGYATNPNYPKLLIDLIERLNLYELDGSDNEPEIASITENPQKTHKVIMMANTHDVLNHKNKIKYIVAKKGDTYYRISKEFGVGLWELYKYNEFGDKKDCLIAGDIIYLEPKKRKASRNGGDKIHLIKQEISLRDLSQLEGIKVQRLMKLNHIDSAEEKLQKGDKILLK